MYIQTRSETFNDNKQIKRALFKLLRVVVGYSLINPNGDLVQIYICVKYIMMGVGGRVEGGLLFFMFPKKYVLRLHFNTIKICAFDIGLVDINVYIHPHLCTLLCNILLYIYIATRIYTIVGYKCIHSAHAVKRPSRTCKDLLRIVYKYDANNIR